MVPTYATDSRMEEDFCDRFNVAGGGYSADDLTPLEDISDDDLTLPEEISRLMINTTGGGHSGIF